eukprot:5605302-Prymnesium_polylepis.1
MDDREQFVQAVFNTFVANGGAEIIKQLVAIKQNANHELMQDETCKQTLEQDWILFITQIVNFGRASPAVNGVITDVNQMTHDDGDNTVEFSASLDYFLYKEIMKVRGIPTMGDQGLGNAMKIRHDLVNLIIQNFVQTTFTDKITSLNQL